LPRLTGKRGNRGEMTAAEMAGNWTDY